MFYVFSQPRASCDGFAPTQRCSDLDDCLLRLHDEDINLASPDPIVDFRTEVGRCNVNPGNLEVAMACQGCDWPGPRECEPGQTSEPVECETGCGVSVRTCQTHCAWDAGECQGESQCTAEEEETESCGNCGQRSRVCDLACTWSEWSACTDEGACTPNDTEVTECGNCGHQTRRCGADCAWAEAAECVEEGDACIPDSVGVEMCEVDGTRQLCDATCQWDWTECDEPVCSGGLFESIPCGPGSCGMQERHCRNDGAGWELIGECESPGECVPGTTEERACGSDVGECTPGTESRRCTPECGWEDFGACEGEIGVAVEICDNGLDEDCDGADSMAVVDAFDRARANDTCNEFTEVNAAMAGDEGELVGTLHSADDIDVYRVPSQWLIDSEKRPAPGADVVFELDFEDPRGMDFYIAVYDELDLCIGQRHLRRLRTQNSAEIDLEWSMRPEDVRDFFYIMVYQAGDTFNCDNGYVLDVSN